MHACSRPRTATLIAALAIPFVYACTTTDELGPESSDPARPGGKADDALADACPPSVRLNSGEGSARRCIDDASGRFVSTVCCAAVCEGAGWREQANGTRCAWVGEPTGNPDALKGQFAPNLCCDLNDELACGRGDTRDSDGACVDGSDEGRRVADACCEEAPVECNVAVRRELSDCATELRFDFQDDPELPVISPLEALELCASEGDLTGEMFDRVCSFHPDSPVCGASIEDFHTKVVPACVEELRDDFDCALGLTFGDIQAPLSTIVITENTDIDAGNLAELDDVAKAQIERAFDLNDVIEADTLAERFDNVDEAFVNYLELWEGTNGQAYVAIEFGQGDNGFGAVFDWGTTDLAVQIVDSDLVTFDDGVFGCGPTVGPRWARCANDDACEEGLDCEGRADHPFWGDVGRCVMQNLGAETGKLEDSCESDDDCPFEAGLTCNGDSFGGGFGTCREIWTNTTLTNEAFQDIPDGDGESLVTSVTAYGLATVPEDAVIEIEIEHDDFSQLRIEVDDAGSEDFLPIFNGAVESNLAMLDKTSGFLRLRRNVPHSGDDEVNGTWTLRITDDTPGGDGTIFGWTLHLSSRMD